MRVEIGRSSSGAPPQIAKWAGWLMRRLSREAGPRPRLVLLERITLAPRQSLALVEAEGRRFLVATSADGAPAFYLLGGPELSRREPVARDSVIREPGGRCGPTEAEGSKPAIARRSW